MAVARGGFWWTRKKQRQFPGNLGLILEGFLRWSPLLRMCASSEACKKKKNRICQLSISVGNT